MIFCIKKNITGILEFKEISAYGDTEKTSKIPTITGFSFLTKYMVSTTISLISILNIPKTKKKIFEKKGSTIQILNVFSKFSKP